MDHAVKDALEASAPGERTHGQLYPDLETFVEQGLLDDAITAEAGPTLLGTPPLGIRGSDDRSG